MLLKISISKSKDLFNPIGVGLFRVLVCGGRGATQLKAIPNLGSAVSKVKVAKKWLTLKLLFTWGGGLRPPPIHPLINPKLIVKLVHFSMESENGTNLWLIGTFPSLIVKNIVFTDISKSRVLATLFH